MFELFWIEFTRASHSHYTMKYVSQQNLYIVHYYERSEKMCTESEIVLIHTGARAVVGAISNSGTLRNATSSGARRPTNVGTKSEPFGVEEDDELDESSFAKE